MSFRIPVNRIAELVRCPAVNVQQEWPLVEQCLVSMGLWSERVCVAAIATIAVETAHTFLPIDEYGSAGYFTRMYDIEGARPEVARELGNTHPGDGAKFHGRGLIQTTGEKNYERAKQMLGVDFLAHPEKAKEPNAAAALFVLFFYDHRAVIIPAANAADWQHVRRSVNGGTNGLDDFLKCVNNLEAELAKNQESAAGAAAGR